MNDPLLFPPPPAHNRTRTSMAAAKAVAERAPTQREIVLDCIRRGGPTGLTHQEIADITGVLLDSVKPRVRELGLIGRVVARAETRTCAKSGAQRTVFVDADLARATLIPVDADWPGARTNWKETALEAIARAEALEDRIEQLAREVRALKGTP